MADQPRRFSMEAKTTGLTPGPIAEIIAPTPLAVGMRLTPSFDVIELLPPAAAERLRQLRQRRDDAHRLCVEFETVHQASMEKIAAQNELTRLTGHPGTGGFGLKAENNSVRQAQKRLDVATADFERIQQLREVRAAAWQSAGAALAACEDWLRYGKPDGSQLVDFDGSEPEAQLKKGEKSLLDAIENRRRRAREIKASIHTIQSSCFPKSYCKERAGQQVDVLVERGAVSVSRLVELDGPLDFPTTHLRSEVVGAEQRALAFTEVTDMIALIAWLHRDLLIKRIADEIDTEGDDASALTHEQRQQREAEAMADLDCVERQEAELCWQAQRENLPCEFRADISPVALLGLQLVSAPRADGLPSTSVEHAFDVRGAGRQR